MSKDGVKLAQFLLRHNTRMEFLELSRSFGSRAYEVDGIPVPENPESHSSHGFADCIAEAYMARKAEVDVFYVDWAKALNTQIGRDVHVYKVGHLGTQLSSIWDQRVGLKVYYSSLIFPEGKINLHVKHLDDYNTVRVSGYSVNEAF